MGKEAKMPSYSRQKDGEENPSYLVSGDRRSLELIFVRIDYATNALAFEEFDNAMINIEAAWQRLPNKIKDKFDEPIEVLNRLILSIPSEDELLNNDNFMQSNPGWKDPERYRYFMEKKLIQQVVQDCANKFIQAIDDAGLYMKESGAGISIFGEKTDFTKGMGYAPPPEQG